MDCTPRVIESQLDWLTLTACAPDQRERLFAFGHDLIRLGAKEEGQRREWTWKGYKGAHMQGVTVGRREDSDILQLSGPLADQWFDVAWAKAEHCTRIDLAVTVEGVGDIGELLTRHEREALDCKAAKGSGPNVSLIRGEGEPQTLYLGQRTSDLYARIYNKGAESREPDYDGCVRYELELKGTVAQNTAAWLGSVANRPDSIRGALFQHFTRRGLGPVFCGVDGTMHLRSIRARTDRATRLLWLCNAVRPCVQRLLLEGPCSEVLEALGLPRTAEEKARLRASLELGTHLDWLQGWRLDGDAKG